MIGKFYSKIFNSKIGSKLFKIQMNEDQIKWSEKGINRFIFCNILVFWISIFSLFSVFTGFSIRLLISSIALSLYFKEKFSKVFVELLSDFDKMYVKRSRPLRETEKFKIISRIMNGDDVKDVLG